MIGFDDIEIGDKIEGAVFETSHETVREYCEASLDYNPLHLDDEFMKDAVGRSNFGGVIVHGMTTFSIITRSLVDWSDPLGGIHRRLETRWTKPVKPGDRIAVSLVVKEKQKTRNSRWVSLEVEVQNQRNEKVACGEAIAEFPRENG